MRILIVKPARAGARSGNDITVRRWSRLLEELGHTVESADAFDGQECDLMVALHAFYSHPSIARFRADRPDGRLIVALGGTDLYRDLKMRPEATESLRLADRILTLQRRAIDELPGAELG